MDEINSEILRQFEVKGLTINEGIAVDARLVKSTSHPVSNDKLKQLREKHNTDEGKLDKNGKSKKISRDLDSVWVVQKDIPHYGITSHLKKTEVELMHIQVGRNQGNYRHDIHTERQSA